MDYGCIAAQNAGWQETADMPLRRAVVRAGLGFAMLAVVVSLLQAAGTHGSTADIIAAAAPRGPNHGEPK